MLSAGLQVSTSHLACRAAGLLTALATLVACTSPPAYRGVGGMTAYRIAPEAYLFHYEKGFTGVDAMGWDANLQFAWSRLGAAKTCGLPFDSTLLTQQLIARFGHDRFAHESNGVDFHHLQSKGIAGFCNDVRVAEVKALLPPMAVGQFASRF